MKIPRLLLLIVLLQGSVPVAEGACKKCDKEKIKMVNDHIGHLTFKMVDEFLCTFDTSCNASAEYSEWSNETLFIVLERAPKLFFDVLSKDHSLNSELLLKEVESPVSDAIDLPKIYGRVKAVAAVPEELKKAYLHALEIAAKKGGVEVR